MNSIGKYISIAILLVFLSCEESDVNTQELNNLSQELISIPEGFDYSTYRKVDIKIADDESYAKYEVYAYTDDLISKGFETFEDESGELITEEVFMNDVINKFLFSGVPKNGILQQSINIPTFYDKIYIRRNENRKYSASIELISDDQVDYTYLPSQSRRHSSANTNVNDYLYCVNGSGEMFQVDPLDGTLTYISNMPMGSYTAAIDQDNKLLYSIGRSSPNPLMKYSIENDTWSTVTNLGFGGPRLDYNTEDNLLYFSNKSFLRSINPLNGNVVNEWNINGLHNNNGGDLAFAEDGTLFLASFSGLYRCDYNTTTAEYDAVRISADNLPFMPTSMTFDSDQNLWLANNASSSDLIIMDTVTGGWQYVWGINAANGTDFGRTINDLTTFRVPNENYVDVDTDGDGIVDIDDEYPQDPDKAFELFTPSEFGTGTIAFEDLWPSNGDYDFNDMALNYQAIVILNSNNMVVQIDFICQVKSNLAGFTNGIGIAIEGLTYDQVQSISGTIYTENYIALNSNGTEANQTNAVIILTDNADNLVNETTMSIVLNNPVSTQTLGEAPFNPFIISNMIRENEIHLPYKSTTALGQSLVQISGQNHDLDGNYISDNGYPWAISIIHDFKVPKESVKIYDAYNFFTDWATSGGQTHKDWYKDNPGNRNQNLIRD